MESSRWHTFTSAGLVVLLLGSACASRIAGRRALCRDASVASAAALIKHHHIAAPSRQSLAEGAIRGMTERLDAHSVYLDRKAHRAFVEDSAGRYAGIGIELIPAHAALVIVRVIPDGPAARAGLQPGDRIVAVGGQKLQAKSLDTILSRLRGKPGSWLRLSIDRPGRTDPLRVALQRAVVRLDPLTVHRLDADILLVQVRVFSEGVSRALRYRLRRALHAHQRLQGLILDLRGNPGGLLHEAVHMADTFIDAGVLVSIRGPRRRAQGVAYASRKRSLNFRGPVVVLIDGLTASAAEVVAAALQEHRRARVVGTRSYGKGTVQELFSLPNGGALKLTIARYHTPLGHSLEGRGLHPDVPVVSASPESDQGTGTAEVKGSPQALAQPSDPRSDPVVQQALRLVRQQIRRWPAAASRQ
ncbi:MAG: S41 family peptidase [Polyangiales bacterium]